MAQGHAATTGKSGGISTGDTVASRTDDIN
jgi:hypothetical protein